MVPADSHRVPRAPRYSGCRLAAPTLRIRGCHPLRRHFPEASARVARARCRGPTTPRGRRHRPRFGLLPVRSPLLGESLLFSLPGGTKMFQFPPFASEAMLPRMTALQAAGLSHSETRGSKVICTSPRIFAAYRVLHRLREPRHPPCALSYFSYRHARKISGRRSYFQLDLAGSKRARGPRHSYIYYSLACPTCQRSCAESCDRCRRTDWLRLSCSAWWRITDSNR